MQTISAGDATKLAAYKRVNLKLYVGGAEIPVNIGSFTLTASVGNGDLSCGHSVASQVTFTVESKQLEWYLATHNDELIITHSGDSILARFDWRGATGCDLSVTWSVTAGTDYDLFTGRIETVTVAGGMATVVAKDALFWYGSEPLDISGMQSTVTAGTALTAIATAMGTTVDADTQTLVSGVSITDGFSSVSNKLNCSDAAGYVAGLFGGNAAIGRDGKLKIVQYTSSGFTSEPYSGECSAENRDYSVTGVSFNRTTTTKTTNADGTVSESSSPVTYSAGDGTLNLDNPLADQSAATRAYNALKTVTSRKGSFSYPMGIQIEPGDLITINSMDGTYPVAVCTHTLTIDGGVKSSDQSAGLGGLSRQSVPLTDQAEQDVSAYAPGRTGTLTKQVEELELELLKVKNLQAENATITSAKITELLADWANIGTAVINTLIANGVSAQWMKVTDSNGNIIFSADQNSHSVQMGGWTATKDELSSSGGGNTISLGNGQISANVVKLENSSSSTEMPTLAFYPRGDNTPMLSIAASGNSMAGYWASFYSPTDLTLDSNTALVLQGGAGSGPSGYSGVTIMGTCNHWGGIYPGSTESYSLGSSSLRWNNIYAKSVNIGGYPAVAKLTKTVSGSTSSSGNISLGLNGNYGILSVRRTDSSAICYPYWLTSGSLWYCHLTTSVASPTAITSTAVTLEVDYYAK